MAFRFLAAGNQPDFRTISEFRRRHGEALAALFTQGLRLCRQAGLVKLGRVAIDGTKIKANASKHEAMSYGTHEDARDRAGAGSAGCCGRRKRRIARTISGMGTTVAAMNCHNLLKLHAAIIRA